MKTEFTRRGFLSTVGQGMLVASVGQLAFDMGVARVHASESDSKPITFGTLEPLVLLMQQTPIEKLLPTLVDRMNQGTDLKSLVAAAALANARTFGGEDYIGYHTLMALAPAWHMSQSMTGPRQALPVLKVLYRNTHRIGETGGHKNEVLHQVTPLAMSPSESGIDALKAAVNAKDIDLAEGTFAAIMQKGPREAFDELLYTVQEDTQVHRTVLPYRAWELLSLVGEENAHTMLRQSVRYCVKEQSRQNPSEALGKAFDQHKLMGLEIGTRAADDQWVDSMCQTIFRSTPEQAADAVAAAIAEGFSVDAIGEAMGLAANQLVLRDTGRTVRQEWPGKPVGSVHGDSVGVHASDSANAWRNMATVGHKRNKFACLILGAYQVAKDRIQGGGDYLNLPPLPIDQPWKRIKTTEPDKLLSDLDSAIRDNLQGQACNIVNHYGQLAHDPKPLFEVLLRYATSEDGALHAEKYYRTTTEEFARTRPAFRWRHAISLARVTASEYGRSAPGYREACELLKVT
ncbi:hypothetical protein K2Y11_16335 [bacterium]|nr:hypothetical protein [bacterium]